MALKLLIVNVLTFIRVIGIIVLITIYNKYGGCVAGIVSLVCYLTDSIDGILARKWHASTFFGALFDGVADKLFTIVNFIILYLITPYALIPIIIELLIILLQMFKFSRNLNIQSNIIGKLKVWFLAITVVLTFLISDIANVPFVSSNFINYLSGIPDNRLYFILLMPAIIMEALTLISYVLEIIKPQNVEIMSAKPKKKNTSKLKGKDLWYYFKNVWLNPKFYEEHKDDNKLRDLRNESKKNS